MKVVQGQTLLYPLEIEAEDEPDDNVLLKLRDLLIRMRDLVSDITAIYETIECQNTFLNITVVLFIQNTIST